MSIDLMDRLRERDPAADCDATPPDVLLEQIVAEPRRQPADRARHRRRSVAVTLGGVATALAVGAVLAVTGGGPAPALVDRAYAQTASDPGILHVVTESRLTSDDRLIADQSEHVESWSRGDRARTVITIREASGKTATYDQVLGSDGSVRNRMSGGQGQVWRPADGPDASRAIASMRAGFVANFRRAYERGVLQAGGPTTFAGHRAQRYVVHSTGASRQDGPAGTATYFVDAETGAPLGAERVQPLYRPRVGDGKVRQGEPMSSLRATEVVTTLEHLPASTENDAKLTP